MFVFHALRALTLVLIASPALAFAWAYGGARADVLVQVMPWAVAACAVGLFVLPQRRPDEGWLAGMRRVWGGIVRDPFFWAAVGFMLYLVVPLFNRGLCPGCDWKAIDAGANPYPPFRFLPFCVNASDHVGILWWFGPTLLTALGVRQGLTRAGKRAFLEILVWNGAALAALGFIQGATGARAPLWGAVPCTQYFFSVFGYPNMGGAYFAFSYALALGLWCNQIGCLESLALEASGQKGRHRFLLAHYPFVAVALTLGAVLATLCRAAMMCAAILTVFFFLYLVLRSFAGNDWGRANRFRSGVVAVALMMGLFGFFFVYSSPEVGRELATLNPFSVAQRVSGKGQYHTRVASSIMRDFPFFGVGGWGYKHFSRSYMTVSERRAQQADGGANVHNDYLQFLAEHGLAGAVLLVACVWLLGAPTGREWKRQAVKALAVERSGMGSSSMLLFIVAPPVLWSVLGILMVLIHAFGDCPLRSAAVLSSILTVLPATYGFLPREAEAPVVRT